MKVGELIELLKKQDPKSNVMITDKNGLFLGECSEVIGIVHYTLIRNKEYKVPRSEKLELYLDRIEQFTREIRIYAEDLKYILNEYKEKENES